MIEGEAVSRLTTSGGGAGGGEKKTQNLSEEAAHENGNMKTLRLYFNEEKKTVRGL